jgi:hypothetical protein
VGSDRNTDATMTSDARGRAGTRSSDKRAAAQRRVTVWFTRRNYPSHRALDPSGLPSTFDEWLANVGHEVERTGPALRVVIDPARFAAWCRAAPCQPDASARMAFARTVAEAAKRRAWWPNKDANLSSRIRTSEAPILAARISTGI